MGPLHVQPAARSHYLWRWGQEACHLCRVPGGEQDYSERLIIIPKFSLIRHAIRTTMARRTTWRRRTPSRVRFIAFYNRLCLFGLIMVVALLLGRIYIPSIKRCLRVEVFAFPHSTFHSMLTQYPIPCRTRKMSIDLGCSTDMYIADTSHYRTDATSLSMDRTMSRPGRALLRAGTQNPYPSIGYPSTRKCALLLIQVDMPILR